jgi:hypothetical protein
MKNVEAKRRDQRGTPRAVVRICSLALLWKGTDLRMRVSPNG